jgi:carbonic anhydrase
MKTAKAFLIGGSAVAMSAAMAQHAGAWGYSGATGPDRWGGLNEDFMLCERGLQQSPIDLGEFSAVGDLKFSVDYKSSDLVVRNSSKGVQADFAPGSFMTSAGKEFSLHHVIALPSLSYAFAIASSGIRL